MSEYVNISTYFQPFTCFKFPHFDRVNYFISYCPFSDILVYFPVNPDDVIGDEIILQNASKFDLLICK